MKKGIFVALFLGMMVLMTGNAHAIVVADINGYDNGEWINLNLGAIDPNEVGLDDRYDIWKIGMIVENHGDANDGLYIGWMMYDVPTFGTYPSPLGKRPTYQTMLDFNSNGIVDANDRWIDFSWGGAAPVLTVYDASNNPVSGLPLSAIGTFGTNAGVEWFIPKSMFASFPIGNFQTFSVLDNGGIPTEDYLPDQGWSTTTPEPGSMALVGMGLFGFVGSLLRRKFNA
jgi:hypothetical protein